MKRTSHLFAAIATVALAAGCLPAGETDQDPEQSEAVAREVGQSIVTTGGAIATLAAPLARALEDDGIAAANDKLRARIEAAVARLVSVTECVSLSWAQLEATVEFDGCHMPATSDTLDGSITVVVRPLKLEVGVTVDDLTLGDNTFHGSVTAYLQGPIGALTVGVDADVTLAGADSTLMIEGLSIDANAAGVTVSGSGAVVSPVVDAEASADVVGWPLGECSPTSGSVSYSQGLLNGTITFLETTPATGEVELHIPPFPPQTVEMFPPCE